MCTVLDQQIRGDMTGRERPILLKKAAMVCASEKYASEIEIFTFGRGVSGLGFHVAACKKGVFTSQ